MTPEFEAATSLVYVADNEPGIHRRRRGKGFSYHFSDGSALRDERHIVRIRKLAIPPAYTNVWICRRQNGHIQATGLDARGRKQYRYHPEWESWRAEMKFNRLLAFSEVLPRIRRRVRRDLQSEPGSLPYMLAALVTLIDATHMRVGNAVYAKQNKTYGATTLLKRHIALDENAVQLRYRAKSGKKVQTTLRNKRLHKILNDIADLPGRQLFSYLDDSGNSQPVESGRLNAYLAEAADMDGVSAKLFRTWAGSVRAFSIALNALQEERPPTINEMVTAASEELHNTKAVCRSSYIHPAIIRLAEEPDAAQIVLKKLANRPGLPPELRAEEQRLAVFLDSVSTAV